jgi:DNA (cytosine-5)-methyltransferase 1/tRNA (cytosine38-C5)-methyltransferase
MRVLELYAGIGGCAAALRDRAEIVGAIEQSDVALAAYRANFPHPTLEKNLNGLNAADLAAFDADLWWMSPPCQSFTVRGAQRDLDDMRAKSFVRLVSIIERVRPRTIALENVPAFSASRAHALLLDALGAAYHVKERILCPTAIGIPNRRARYYLVASIDHLADWRDGYAGPRRTLSTFLGEVEDRDPALDVPSATVAKYHWAMQILERGDEAACARCFTSAYGRSPVRSGAHLRTARGVRHFSPAEILCLLGFPEAYALPAFILGLKDPRPSSPLLPFDSAAGGRVYRRAWSLIGNSLSVPAVQEILSIVPDG